MSEAAAGGWRRSELAYCSNVHPGESAADVAGILPTWVAAVARVRGVARAGAGLWLSAAAAAKIDGGGCDRFRERLATHGIELFTLNGFPYGGFHARSVKQRVYTPHWADPRRVEYTLALARILAECLPHDYDEGTISTLPLGFRPHWNEALHEQAAAALCRLAARLDELAQSHGRPIRVCLEMEPGGVLESTEQTVELFTKALPAAAKRLGIDTGAVERHLGVCYDVCHQAVMFEDPAESLSRLSDAEVTVGKVQISCALELARPGDEAQRRAAAEFAEPRYLHQVRARGADGELVGSMDLPDALAGQVPTDRPWRIHFHVPIQVDTLAEAALGTTQGEIGKVLDVLAAHRHWRPHLEVETYTWQVMPDDLRPHTDEELVAGLAAELTWLEDALRARDLLTPDP